MDPELSEKIATLFKCLNKIKNEIEVRKRGIVDGEEIRKAVTVALSELREVEKSINELCTTTDMLYDSMKYDE